MQDCSIFGKSQDLTKQMICISTLTIHSYLYHRSIYSFLLQRKPLHLTGFRAANSVPSSIRRVAPPSSLLTCHVSAFFSPLCSFAVFQRVYVFDAPLPGVCTFLSYPNINTTGYTS